MPQDLAYPDDLTVVQPRVDEDAEVVVEVAQAGDDQLVGDLAIVADGDLDEAAGAD